MALWKLVPPEEGSDFCHRLVFHGRDVCTARTKPRCEACCLNDICKKSGSGVIFCRDGIKIGLENKFMENAFRHIMQPEGIFCVTG